MYKKLRDVRNNKGVTARKMADLLGLKTEAAYYKKEAGLIKFSIEEARLIADKLGVSVEEIFFNQDVSVIETTV